MKIKNVLIGGGLFAAGYGVGQIVGFVRCGKYVADLIEEEFPGFKNFAAKKASDKVIDHIFKDEEEEEEEA